MRQCKIYLKPKKEESLLRFHPWVFSGAIHSIVGNPEEGDMKTLMRRPLTFPEGMRCTCEGHLAYCVEGVWPFWSRFQGFGHGSRGSVFSPERKMIGAKSWALGIERDSDGGISEVE